MTTTTTVKARPIILTGESVRAVLAGANSATRRVIKPQPKLRDGFTLEVPGPMSERAIPVCWDCKAHGVPNDSPYPQLWLADEAIACPYKIGGLLWVKEAWGADHQDYIDLYKTETWRGTPCTDGAGIHYRATEADPGIFPKGYWRSPQSMPRWASRLTLEVVSVRAERLESISEEDAKAEGVSLQETVRGHKTWAASYRAAFAARWEIINGRKHPWASNPWCWAVAFKVVEGVPA